MTGSYGSTGSSSPASNGLTSVPNGNSNGNNNGECRDYTGRAIQHAMHFVPPGVDMCKLCICENGHAKSCRAVLCTPPPDCKSFQMGTSCCEFICLDDHLGSPSTTSDIGI
ncbi:hypothetical protein PVAND_009644 [Polypedilum vanderplanki]|uniref:VWFC domain-containing protein n=1 Tax=Polypedilum vanderplanki TaxID=319348 RepID=A0A9J6CDU4_POLVA|nr:hypothetical protein PVAND_009644 [Polypedilum vanderplanki]